MGVPLGERVGEPHLHLAVEAIAGLQVLAADHHGAREHAVGAVHQMLAEVRIQGIQSSLHFGEGRLGCELGLQFAVGRAQQGGVDGVIARRGNQVGREALGLGVSVTEECVGDSQGGLVESTCAAGDPSR